MKKHFLIASILILSFFITTKISAQTEWFPDGAKWYYGLLLSPLDSPEQSYKTFEVIGEDVVISFLFSKTCKLIKEESYDLNNEVVYSESFTLCYDSNKVYYYEEVDHEIFLLYDFNADKNDTWVTRIQSAYSSFVEDDSLRTITVDSVSEMIISNDTLKVLYTSASYGQYSGFQDFYFSNPIIEKIGAHYFFMELWAIMDVNIPSLRCYIDNSISYTTNSNIPCDTIIRYIPYVNYYKSLNNDIIVYPNPADNEITIKLQTRKFNTELNILIYDLKGICHYNIIFNNIKDEYRINTSSLESGCYILKIFSNNILTQKKLTIIR